MSGELQVAVVADEDGRLRVVAPAVGWWSSAPAPGTTVGPGAEVGRLRVLNRRFVLRMPDGAEGTVSATPVEKIVPVQYGETLFRLERPLAGRSAPTPSQAEAAASDGELPAGSRAVRAPSDGVFYRRPAPGSPPFVEPGATVHAGQPLGLVEVMKTFNQILYGGPGLPPQAEVVEIRPEDAEEVRAGQILIVVR